VPDDPAAGQATAKIAFTTLGYHETPLRVPFNWVDGYRTLWHGHAPACFEIARADLARPHGVSAPALRSLGLVAPMLDIACEYQAPAFDDEMLVIQSCLLQPSLPIPELVFRYRVVRSADGRMILRGRSRQLITREDGRIIVRLPAAVKDGLDSVWSYLAMRPRWDEPF
jgi:acyl-CoA thioester hydrolase